MSNFQLSVVHRLPQSYRWLSGFTGVRVEPLPLTSVGENNKLLGLKLLSHVGARARHVMQQLHLSLMEIQVESTIVEWEEEPCLFVSCRDESTVMCRLQNMGVVIAETAGVRSPC